VLRASALEEGADAWAFLAMSRRQEEATRQATLRDEEERLLRLKHEADLEAVAAKQREKEAARDTSPTYR
jgi:hypothetical protein